MKVSLEFSWNQMYNLTITDKKKLDDFLRSLKVSNKSSRESSRTQRRNDFAVSGEGRLVLVDRQQTDDTQINDIVRRSGRAKKTVFYEFK